MLKRWHKGWKEQHHKRMTYRGKMKGYSWFDDAVEFWLNHLDDN
jgi:hypothetical protein